MNDAIKTQRFRQPGVLAALWAELLFGSGTPLAKGLLGGTNPWILAGLLYLGSGLGLSLYRAFRPKAQVTKLARSKWAWFIGAIVAGGVIGPVLLMFGLQGMPASGASLLLNTEGVFTALLAWFVFRENFDRRIAVGMAAIVCGAVILSWPQEVRLANIGLPADAAHGPSMGLKIMAYRARMMSGVVDVAPRRGHPGAMRMSRTVARSAGCRGCALRGVRLVRI
jgi:drug/metabolite transporter (DMT)-like permease